MTETRDWAFVQREPCEACGFDPTIIATDAIGDSIRAVAADWVAFLGATDDGDLRRPPSAEVWSALSYACHTRDVFERFRGRIELTLSQDSPDVGWWNHEAAAVEERYDAQRVDEVAAALAANADAMADVLATVAPGERDRPAVRRGRAFTVAGLGRFALHEGRHHLHDVRTIVG